MPNIMPFTVAESLIVTFIQVAPSMTWALVRTNAVPLGYGVSKIKPEPLPWLV